MNDHWLFELNTTIPYACPGNEWIESNVLILDSFEEARDYFRRELKRYSFEDNQLFDGNGHVKNINKFLDENIGKSFNLLNEQKNELKQSLSSALFKMFSGKDVAVSMSDDTKRCLGDNSSYQVLMEPDEVDIYEKCDQYYHGRDDRLQTNAFTMKDEKNYFFRLYDFCGHCRFPCYPYLELELYKIEKNPERFKGFEYEDETDDEPASEQPYPCDICGCTTPFIDGYWGICPECGWEGDDFYVEDDEELFQFITDFCESARRRYRARYKYIKQKIPEYRWTDGYNINPWMRFEEAWKMEDGGES